MPYAHSAANWPAIGTLTSDDRDDIMATLEAAGIDTSVLAVTVTPSGNAFFTRRVSSRGMANDIRDADLLDRIADALHAAGWTVSGQDGQRDPGLILDVLNRPTPAVGDQIAVPDHAAPGHNACTGEVVATDDDTVTVALEDGSEHVIPIDAIVPTPWSISQVAAFLGVQPGSARGQLSRWGVRARSHHRGADGKVTACFLSTEVRAAMANRPGRGARTDLRP